MSTLKAKFQYKGKYVGELWVQDERDDTDTGVYCRFNYMIYDQTHEYLPSEELPNIVRACEKIRIVAERVKTISDWFKIVKIDTGDYNFEITQL